MDTSYTITAEQYEMLQNQGFTDLGVSVASGSANILLSGGVWGVFVLVLLSIIGVMAYISVKIWKHKATLDHEKNVHFAETIEKMHKEDREDRKESREVTMHVKDALDQLSELIKYKD